MKKIILLTLPFMLLPAMKRLITIGFCFYLLFVISGCSVYLASEGMGSSESMDIASVCDLSTREEIERDFSPIKTEVLENGNKVVTYEDTSYYSAPSESRAEVYGGLYGINPQIIIFEPLLTVIEGGIQLFKMQESKRLFAVTYLPDDSVFGCGTILIDKPYYGSSVEVKPSGQKKQLVPTADDRWKYE